MTAKDCLPQPDEVLRQRWLELTRRSLPERARVQAWPLRHDHCFQRVILDAVCGGRWYDSIAGRPAYRHMTATQLDRAVRLAERLAVSSDARSLLERLNEQSLRWRREAAGGARVRP